MIEIVDSAERIDSLLIGIDSMIDEGLITIERVHILKYEPGKKRE